MAKLALNNTTSTGYKSTGAGAEVIATFDTSFIPNAVFMVEVSVLASDVTNNNESAGYVIIGTFDRRSGTLAIVGSTTAVHTAETTAGWACTVTASGNNIQVNGTAEANALWAVNAEVTMLTNGPVRGDN